MNTRTILAGAGSAVLMLSLAACSGGSSDDGKSLTVVSYGGAPQKKHFAAWFDGWADDNDVTIRQDSPTDYAKLKAQVDSGKVSWDLVHVEPNFAETACAAGLLEKIETSSVDLAGVDADQVTDCGVPTIQYSYGIAYNTEAFPDDHPTTWAEFFDTDKVPGKRALFRYASGGLFEAALLADGVAAEDLYPLDIDRALRKLDTIKDDIVWFDTGDQQEELLATGEASLAIGWSGRIEGGAASGKPFGFEWNQNLGSYDTWVIPKGSPNRDLAEQAVLDLLVDVDAEADAIEAYYYGPANDGALAKVSEETRDKLPNAHVDERAVLMDYGYWAENFDAVSEKLNTWLAG